MTQATLSPPPVLAADNCVLLDFDGTLVEIADRPDAVSVDPLLMGLLGSLARDFAGRVALVSGRSVAQLADLLPQPVAGLALVGSHGAEVQADARAHASRAAARVRPELDRAEQAIRAHLAGLPGVLVEAKTLGVAVHYRLAPEHEPTVRTVVDRLASQVGLVIQEGKMMLELRPAGEDKGTGIAALMASPPFAGTVPVFAGDDVTDEAGFAAVARMGGHGVLVGPERPTAARYRLADVGAVRQWLGRRP